MTTEKFFEIGKMFTIVYRIDGGKNYHIRYLKTDKINRLYHHFARKMMMQGHTINEMYVTQGYCNMIACLMYHGVIPMVYTDSVHMTMTNALQHYGF